MNASDDLERRLADFYRAEAPRRAPDRVLAKVLETLDSTRQRHALFRVPWRFPIMNTNARLAVAALAVVVVGVAVLAVLGGRTPDGGIGASPSGTGSPSPAASEPPTGGPALDERYLSAVNAIAISYPAGWTVQPATEPWTNGTITQDSPFVDVIYEKETDSPFIGVASRALGSKSGDQWVLEQMGQWQCQQTESLPIDGIPGTLGECVDGPVAATWIEDRGYVVWLYRVDDVAWFKEILATVRLQRTATGFRQPFGYILPITDLPWDVPSAQPTVLEFRIPDSGGPGQSAFGVIVRAIDGGRVDPCAASSDALPLAAGPQAVLDYLNVLPRVRVDSRTATTIGGMAAIRAIVNTTPPDANCQELRPFAKQIGVEEEEVITQAPPETWIMVSVVDVNGDHLVIWTWAEQPRFYALAGELIGSFRFHTTEASPSG